MVNFSSLMSITNILDKHIQSHIRLHYSEILNRTSHFMKIKKNIHCGFTFMIGLPGNLFPTWFLLFGKGGKKNQINPSQLQPNMIEIACNGVDQT